MILSVATTIFFCCVCDRCLLRRWTNKGLTKPIWFPVSRPRRFGLVCLEADVGRS